MRIKRKESDLAGHLQGEWVGPPYGNRRGWGVRSLRGVVAELGDDGGTAGEGLTELAVADAPPRGNGIAACGPDVHPPSHTPLGARAAARWGYARAGGEEEERTMR